MRAGWLVAPLALMLSACSSGPESVAENFVEKAAAGETAAAMEMIDPSIRAAGGQKLMTNIQNAPRSYQTKGGLADVKASEVSSQGDYATVNIEETYRNGEKGNSPVKLRKVDGTWYITM